MTWPRWLVSVSSRVAAADLDPLGQLPHLHRQIDALPGADRQLDAVGHGDGETLLFGGDEVRADPERRELEDTVASDFLVWLTPVATLVSVTVASAITAPELSRTVPTIEAVSNWPMRNGGENRTLSPECSNSSFHWGLSSESETGGSFYRHVKPGCKNFAADFRLEIGHDMVDLPFGAAAASARPTAPPAAPASAVQPPAGAAAAASRAQFLEMFARDIFLAGPGR